MSQGEGSHAARGGAPAAGAGFGTRRGGASELVPAGGGALVQGAEPSEVGLEPEGGGASGTDGEDSRALEAGLQPGSGVAAAQEKVFVPPRGGASALRGGPRLLEGGAKESGPGLGPGNGPARPRGGGLRGGGAWGRGRPRTPPGEVVWVERARRPPDTGPVWVPRRPPRAQSWGGVPGGGTGPAWGVSSEDRGSPEPPSGDVWVPRGRPPAAAAEVWVCWAGGNWVWREWGRPVGASVVQPERVWTLRKGTGGN
ncbi:translation initiation factor IF-2 [Sorex araneus]|uniref:translation initiation factor IF-2 n=1 Tax=Sorex araneus TaxID=42254 RepID=UPI0024339BF6|nr:translation initiation factor IF-2 [Sorex araneus]